MRVIGPTCATSPKAEGGYAATRPKVGLWPTIPQNAAGMRIEPPASVPTARGPMPAATAAALPPLLFDDDEAVAVALGLRTAASGGVTGIDEASVRALLKLEQVLPPRLRHRVAALHGFIVPLESRRARVDASLVSLLAGACRDHEGLRFNYKNRTDVSSTRVVEPHRVVQRGSATPYRPLLAPRPTD